MLARIAATVSVLVSACACAVAAPDTPVTPLQASAIEASCTTIMGMRKGEFGYVLCRDSLVNTAAGMNEGRVRTLTYDACHRRGLAEGSAALATCVLDGDTAASAPAAAPQAAVMPVALPHADLKVGSGFYGVTHAVQWRREQYSCAQLGLVPGSSTFAHCVASLDTDLQNPL